MTLGFVVVVGRARRPRIAVVMPPTQAFAVLKGEYQPVSSAASDPSPAPFDVHRAHARKERELADPDALLTYLSSRQHLHPHATVHEVLDATIGSMGCCPRAIDRALEWLGIERTRAIGRLRRSELVQLARAVHRFWMQNLEAANADV
jgi:hypothetical protein